GLSILLPDRLPELPQLNAPVEQVRRLSQGPRQQRILRSARHLAVAAALGQAGAEHAADALIQSLWDWMTSLGANATRERITARRRRELVEAARRWMDDRLDKRFSLEELSGALGLSPRQLQYSFRDELGRSPMEEAKRLRLQRLRSLLGDPAQDQRSVAELMVASGLVASGVTSADYRHFWGENPSTTRRLRA
ncbi:MAG: helix-turn-helix domain-containing protein, partial [Synechococcaceae cyanobacterium]|nr:helix-turn-helix domain-containing protein [Synechococcaceae cyanobacterium]